MYLEYKAKEKRNKREGVLLKGIILGRFARMEKNIENT
jgi:hypothetical protein